LVTPVRGQPAFVAPTDDVRVSTVELFFDLVFVFTITQVTLLITADPSWARLAQAALVFGNVWYMYGAYAWLTNARPPQETVYRLLLLLAMAAFLLLAVSTPRAFGDNSAVFGIAYLVVTLVNTVLFLRVDPSTVTRRGGRLRPFNLTAALLILGAGFADGALQWGLWVLAFLVHWTEAPLFQVTDIGIRSTHFVERHGLILIITLGESVVAVGVALSGHRLGSGDVAIALLGLVVVASLWWLYFDGDDTRAEQRLARSSPRERAHLAIYGFGYGFLVILGGIIVLAAGLHGAVEHYDTAVPRWDAALLAAGAAASIAGIALLRRVLRIGPVLPRLLGAGAVLLTVPIGRAGSGLAQVAAVAAVLVAVVAFELTR
jgi:low temperature requirement protein LtrA